jgi:hypothetical protein
MALAFFSVSMSASELTKSTAWVLASANARFCAWQA